MLKAVCNNPELLRLIRTKLRTRGMLLLAVLGALLFGLTFLGFYWQGQQKFSGLRGTKMLNSFFYTVVGIQMAIIAFYGLSQSSQSVTIERERQTYDFQRLVAMGPWRLALGKLLGTPIEAAFLAACAWPFLAIAAMGQGISLGAVVLSQLVLVLLYLTISSLGMFFSCMVEKSSRAIGLLVVIMIFVFYSGASALTALIGSAQSSILGFLATISPIAIIATVEKPYQYTFNLLGITLPALCGYVLLQLSATALFLTMSVRKLTDDEISLLSTRQATIAFVLAQLLIVMASWDHFLLSAAPALQSFHILNAVVLIALAFAIVPSAELLQARVYRGQRNEHWRMLLQDGLDHQGAFPMKRYLLLLCIYGIESSVLAVWYSAGEAAFMAPLMVVGAAVGMISTLVYIQLYVEKHGIRFGVGALFLALLVPPLILALFQQDWDGSILVSPLVYLAQLSDLVSRPWEYGARQGISGVWACPLICTLLGIAAYLLCGLRARFMLDVLSAEREHQKTAAPPQPRLQELLGRTPGAMLAEAQPAVTQPK